jgi:hypothetical protein
MAEPLKRSLASWREAHGFGVLDILGPRGESFWVETRPQADPLDTDAWSEMSEPQVRAFLLKRGLSDSDAEEVIQLSREWATTVTGVSVFPTPKGS